MSQPLRHSNFIQAEAIVRTLLGFGVQRFFVAPGSRSSPLALAVSTLAHHKAIIHFDERGLAFAALGHAKATQIPSVIICTSGTAVANVLPAVVEASLSAIPLILLTADRPSELHGRGANQTIPQRRIFGEFVRWESECDIPSDRWSDVDVNDTISHAIKISLSAPAGPVHLNCPYREPLAPDTSYEPNTLGRNASYVARHTGMSNSNTMSVEHQMSSLIDRVKKAERGLIIVGRLDSDSERDEVAALTNALGWPVFADITSQLRLSTACRCLVEHFDLLLLSDIISDDLRPGIIVHIGGEFVSKRLLTYLEKHPPREFIHISPDPRRRDPAGCVTEKIVAPYSSLKALSQQCQQPNMKESRLHDACGNVSFSLAGAFDGSDILTEIGVARALVSHAPETSVLFLSSSLSIRLVDSYAPLTKHSLLVGANRGASGIDGVVASAAGFAMGSHRPTTLLIGDLALLHDLNSLALVKHAPLSFVIVVLNNDGGGIFHLLPIAESAAQFETYWGTPHGIRFNHIAKSFGLAYHAPASMVEFRSLFSAAHASAVPTLIEVATNRHETASSIRETQSILRSILP